jgi:hypothetical protein
VRGGVDRVQIRGELAPVLLRGIPEGVADRVDDAGLHHRLGKDRLDRVRQACEAVADDEEHIGHASVLQLREHAHPELRGLPATVARPQPEHVLVAGKVDPDRGVDGPVADLAIADLDVDGVDEDRDVDLAVSSHQEVAMTKPHVTPTHVGT